MGVQPRKEGGGVISPCGPPSSYKTIPGWGSRSSRCVGRPKKPPPHNPKSPPSCAKAQPDPPVPHNPIVCVGGEHNNRSPSPEAPPHLLHNFPRGAQRPPPPPIPQMGEMNLGGRWLLNSICRTAGRRGAAPPPHTHTAPKDPNRFIGGSSPSPPRGLGRTLRTMELRTGGGGNRSWRPSRFTAEHREVGGEGGGEEEGGGR